MKKFAAIFAAAVLAVTLTACINGANAAEGSDGSAFVTAGIENF